MKIGAVFPTCEIGDDPVAIRDFAQAAESLGFDHLLTYDHVLGAKHAERTPRLEGPYTEDDPFHEPFVLFAYLAALTERIEFATGVLILPQRQTALVAKQAAELSLLSGGRLRLGVGTGWNWVEYDALGSDYASRGARLTEQVAVLRELWSAPAIDFDGAHHRIDRAGILPLPPAPIPVWFGGFSPPAIRRAARIGDGFVFGGASTPMQRLAAGLRAELDAIGRDPAEVGIEAIVHVNEGPDGWLARLEKWQALGCTHYTLGTMAAGDDPGFATPQEHIDALARFAEVVGRR